MKSIMTHPNLEHQLKVPRDLVIVNEEFGEFFVDKFPWEGLNCKHIVVRRVEWEKVINSMNLVKRDVIRKMRGKHQYGNTRRQSKEG